MLETKTPARAARIVALAAFASALAFGLLVAGSLAPGTSQAHAAKLTAKKVKVKGLDATYAYTGKKVKPKPKVYYGKRLLVRGKGYKLSYKANKKVGTATIRIKGKGKYRGTVSKTFKIRYSLKKHGSIKLVRSSLPYTGTARKPQATVKYGKRTLSPGTDYTLSYANSVEVGTATVTAKGKGAYAFKVKKPYSITAGGGKVVDLSEHDGDGISWGKVAARVDAAILRSFVTLTLGDHAHAQVGDGRWRADYRYDAYASGCEAAGIPYGAYGYLVYKGSLADALEDARQQADALWEASFSGGHAPLYLVLDIEDDGMKRLGTNVATCVGAAAERLQELARAAGYANGVHVGLYVGNHVYSTFGFNSTAGAKVIADKVDFVWIPSYGKNTGGVPAASYRPSYAYDMWQYSSNATVAGIPGKVDVSRIDASGPKRRDMGWYWKR